MHQTFKQYLVEARYSVRAELKPRALVGSYATYNEDHLDDQHVDRQYEMPDRRGYHEQPGRRGYSELSRGRFPVIRLFTPHWKYTALYSRTARPPPLEEQKTEGSNWVLHDPKPIIVNVINELTMLGKRLSEIEIIEGGDQLVSYWTAKPYKGYKKRYKVFREDPNFETGLEEPLSTHLTTPPFYAMTKDLKRL